MMQVALNFENEELGDACKRFLRPTRQPNPSARPPVRPAVRGGDLPPSGAEATPRGRRAEATPRGRRAEATRWNDAQLTAVAERVSVGQRDAPDCEFAYRGRVK